MTPEQLVAKIVVSYNCINSVYKNRAFPNTIYSLEEIKKQGGSKTMELHGTRDLQRTEYSTYKTPPPLPNILWQNVGPEWCSEKPPSA
jgi:hypothetical protein